MKTIAKAQVTFITSEGEEIEAPLLESKYEADRDLLSELIEELEADDFLALADDEGVA